jgi:hypothetical protein
LILRIKARGSTAEAAVVTLIMDYTDKKIQQILANPRESASILDVKDYDVNI